MWGGKNEKEKSKKNFITFNRHESIRQVFSAFSSSFTHSINLYISLSFHLSSSLHTRIKLNRQCKTWLRNKRRWRDVTETTIFPCLVFLLSCCYFFLLHHQIWYGRFTVIKLKTFSLTPRSSNATTWLKMILRFIENHTHHHHLVHKICARSSFAPLRIAFLSSFFPLGRRRKRQRHQQRSEADFPKSLFCKSRMMMMWTDKTKGTKTERRKCEKSSNLQFRKRKTRKTLPHIPEFASGTKIYLFFVQLPLPVYA